MSTDTNGQEHVATNDEQHNEETKDEASTIYNSLSSIMTKVKDGIMYGTLD